MAQNLRQVTQWLVTSWLVIGIFFTILSFFHFMHSSTFWLLGVPFGLLILIGFKTFYCFLELPWVEKMLFAGLILIWLLHAIGVLVPETGFDAVWYHLPVAEAVIAARGLVVLPDLYQSLNPLFSDLVLAAGFGLGRELGAKLVAYGLAATLVLVTYQLARLKISRFWSLWLVLCVSLFQVITWQASSFYVDAAKALWEIAALWVLLQTKKELPQRAFVAGSFLGASIATKAFSWILLPVFLLLILQISGTKKIKTMSLAILGTLSLGLPFYFRTWWITGMPFLSIGLHLKKLDEIGGSHSLINYVLERATTFPTSLWTLVFLVRDYTSPILIIFLPLVIFHFRYLWSDIFYRSLLLFGLMQYVLWWVVPPLSTRYALSGFIVLLLVAIGAAERTSQKNKNFFKPLVLTLLLTVGITFLPRLVVATKNLEYLVTKPSLEKYLPQFYDGSLDEHLKRWYRLPT